MKKINKNKLKGSNWINESDTFTSLFKKDSYRRYLL